MCAFFSGRGRGGTETRAPAVAGAFYPSSPSNLKEMIDDFLANAEKHPIDGKLVALMVPHAGYVYSGQVAAYAYKQIEGMHFDTVVLVGLSHRSPIRGASIYKSGKYETPLGTVEIDSELAEELIVNNEIFNFEPGAHAVEHSIEVQVPFLQAVLSDFKIVPILMRNWSKSVCLEVSSALAKSIRGKNALLIASSDMTHYPAYAEAVKADEFTLSALKTMDTDLIREQLDEYMTRGVRELHCMLCGRGAVLVVMDAAKELGADSIEILKYANSGDVPIGDKSGVVGYFAAAVYQSD
jgi:AmmeMemoRadiSam system protein B